MNRPAMTLVVAAVIAGAALFVFLRGTSNDNEASDASSAGSFAAQTSWGEPNLTGVWKAEPLGARAGRDTFNLTELEALYTRLLSTPRR